MGQSLGPSVPEGPETERRVNTGGQVPDTRTGGRGGPDTRTGGRGGADTRTGGRGGPDTRTGGRDREGGPDRQ